jgi:proteasome lid subunit RPN8/RPN11
MSGPLQADRPHIAEIVAQILDLERSLYALRAEKTLVQERLDSYKYPVLTVTHAAQRDRIGDFHPVPTGLPCLSAADRASLADHSATDLSQMAAISADHPRAVERPPFDELSHFVRATSSYSRLLAGTIQLLPSVHLH